jgi:hypothetical protein
MPKIRQTVSIALWTTAGTVAHFERETSRLLHRPPAAPATLGLVLVRDGARLVCAGSDPPLAVLPTHGGGPCTLVPMEAAPPLSLVEQPGGPLCLFQDGAALRALPDGTIRLAGGPPDAGAFFLAVTAQAMRCAEALQSDRWVDLATGLIHPAAAAVPAQPGRLDFAGRVFSIGGTVSPFAADPSPRTPLHRVHAVLPEGAMLHAARFRPLIYFAAYGGNLYYECLRLALQSLAEHGAFDGTLCIAADRPRGAVRRLVPGAFEGRWLHRETTADAGLFARYDIDGWGLEGYSPILYLDADVIINAPLTPLLTLLSGSGRVHAGTSNFFVPHLAGRPYGDHDPDLADWFGAFLFGHDPRLAGRPFAMGGSGTIGFATVADARLAFDTVRALRRSVSPERLAKYGDQPLFNYALHTLDCGDFTTLDPFIELARDASECSTARRGLMHFHAGVGNVRVKHESMRSYSASLRRADFLSAPS